MAERRMFAKTIIDSDAFLDMPLTSQALYFHLSMRADDDGFINNPKKIQRTVGATADDLNLLILKKFIIPFESGIVVIKHWKIHNYIQSDRYKPTVYQEEKALLSQKSNKTYTLDTECIQDVYGLDTQVRLGKDRLGKDRLGKNIGSEPKNDSEQAENTIYADVPKIPLSNGEEWQMPLELYEEYKKIYPAVNLDKEIGQMRIWSLSNPTKKKTKRGITRFVNSWLSREQDKYHAADKNSGVDNIKI